MEIINISLKGAAVSEYSKFIDVNGDNFFTQNWVEVAEVVEGKKGSITYSSPIFKKSTSIKDASKIRPFAEILQAYMNEYMGKGTSDKVGSAVDEYDSEKSDDGLPF